MTLPDRARQFLSGVFADATDNRIAGRQLAELQRHIPSLYVLLSVNACALAYTHYALAPAWMTVGVPGLLGFLCIVRAVHWWRIRADDLTEAQAVRQLRLTSVLTTVLSIAFVAWAMTLNAYGGPFEQGHVAMFVAITVVACILCLTHLPIAAFLATAIVSGVFLHHCLTSGNTVFVAIALNTAFVTVVMIRILASNFIAFLTLGASQAETQRLAEENAALAHTDSLTGIPNRRYFFQRLDTLLAAAAQRETSFALAIFDLDRFKPINDTYGHNTGDRVLTEAGRRLAPFRESGWTVARLGGDEFGILIPSPGSPDAAIAACNRVCEALRAPIRLGEMQVATGCSGGLALYPDAGRNAEALFDRADYALYHSKESRRGVTTLFSQTHEDTIRAERAVETELGSADLAAEMEMYYQPIIDTTTNAITMVEALARWTNASLGRVPPDRFIAAAERGGMIHSLTLLLLRKALVDIARLPPWVGLSFNLSSHDLASSETVLSILAAVRESRIDPRRITLELTETALMRDFDGASQAITVLRALGMKIALDDFGSGYSSLGYVHRLTLDKIKIDRSFMSNIDTDLGRSVVSTIMNLCENLGLDGIAEGIETTEQFDAARRHGCRYVQGYLLGAPMPMGALLARFQTLSPAAPESLCA